MKKLLYFRSGKNFVAGIFLALTVSSCSYYNFYYAQPSGKKNIYSFPKGMRRSWAARDDSTTTIIITRKYLLLLSKPQMNIIDGAWPKRDVEGKVVYDIPCNRSLQTIIYDSTGNPVDTIDNYIIRGNRLFSINSEFYKGINDGKLDNGYNYRKEGDTIYAYYIDTLAITTGPNAFLRRLNKNYYVLNFRNSVYNYDRIYSDWWQVYIIEKSNRRKFIRIFSFADKLKNMGCVINFKRKDEEQVYVDTAWTSDQMMQLIKNKYLNAGDTLFRKK